LFARTTDWASLAAAVDTDVVTTQQALSSSAALRQLCTQSRLSP